MFNNIYYLFVMIWYIYFIFIYFCVICKVLNLKIICKLIFNIENNYYFLIKVKEFCWRLVIEKNLNINMLMIKFIDGFENRFFLMFCKKDINKEFRKCIILNR